MTKPSDTLARLRARSQEAGRFVLATDRQWAEQLSDAYRKVRQAEVTGVSADEMTKLRADVSLLELAAGDNAIVFKFRRLGKVEYEELLAAHPATPAQRKIWEENSIPTFQRKIWDEETFEPDLVYRVLIDPKMTLDEVTELLRAPGEDPPLSAGEARDLANAAVAAAISIPPRLPDELRLP